MPLMRLTAWTCHCQASSNGAKCAGCSLQIHSVFGVLMEVHLSLSHIYPVFHFALSGGLHVLCSPAVEIQALSFITAFSDHDINRS